MKKRTNFAARFRFVRFATLVPGLIPLPDLINHAASGVIPRRRTAMYGGVTLP